jgi:hypothetical protein
VWRRFVSKHRYLTRRNLRAESIKATVSVVSIFLENLEKRPRVSVASGAVNVKSGEYLLAISLHVKKFY